MSIYNTTISSSIAKAFFLVCFCLFLSNPVIYAQNNQGAQPNAQVVKQQQPPADKKVELKHTTNTTVKEEIQRYIGYEELPARYLTLPYDMCMNVNVQGAFIDISFLLLMFLPLYFLLAYMDSPLKGTITMVSILLLLVISVANSPFYGKNMQPVKDDQAIEKFVKKVPFSAAPTGFIVSRVHNTMEKIYAPIHSFIKATSGDKDYYTYPLLIALFFALFFPLQDRMSKYSKKQQAGFNFIYIYSFFWMILTAGIIWYGFLMIALGTMLAVYAISKYYKSEDKLRRYMTYTLFSLLSFWLIMATTYRFNNYQPVINDASAKRLIDPAFVGYLSGMATKKQVINSFFQLNGAMDIINNNKEAKIFRVGTVLTYFIEKNDERVLGDNQLGLFNNLHSTFVDKNTITEVLYASGYRYILVDLNTHTIDRTPERTLTKKFEKFMDFIFRNPRLKLLATDRRIRIASNDGSAPKIVNDIWGKDVVDIGKYAIYEIIE